MSEVKIDVKVVAQQAVNELKKLNAAVTDVESSVKQTTTSVNKFENSLSNIEKLTLASVLQGPLSRAFGFVSNQIKASITNFVEYENAVVRLARITDLPIDQQKRLVDNLKLVSLELGVSSQALLNYATIAASAGVRGEQALTTVAKTLAQIELSTNVSGEAAAQSILRILNLTKEGAAGVKSFGNILAQLGDDSNALESEIVSFSEEIARAGTLVGLSATDVQVLATSFVETGATAETARTAVIEFYTNLTTSIRENNSQLPVFERLIGLSGQALKDLVQTNPAEALVRFTKAANTYQQQNGDLAFLLKTVGIEEKRNVATLSSLSSNYNILEKNLKIANDQLAKQDKLQKETEKATNTTNAALIRQGEIYRVITEGIGSLFAPAIKIATNAIASFVEFLEKNETAMTIFKGTMILVTGLVTVFVAQLSLMAFGLFATSTAFTVLAGAAATAWAVVTAPITLVIAGIAAVSFVVLKLTGFWDSLSESVSKWLGLSTQSEKQSKKESDELEKQSKLLDKQSKDIIKNSQDKIKASQEGAAAAGTITQKELEALQKQQENQKKSNSEKEKEQRRHAEEMKKIQEEILKDLAAINVNEETIRQFKRDGESKLLNDILGLNQNFFTQLELLRAQEEINNIASEERKQAKIYEIMKMASDRKFQLVQQEDALNQESAIVENELALEKSNNLKMQLDSEILLRQDYLTREEEIRFQAMLNAAKTEEQKAKIIAEIKKKSADNELRIERTKNQAILDSTGNFLGAIASLARSGSKQNLQIFKAAATAQAIISTYAAINRALAELPFPANVIQSAALGVQGFANVRNIQNTAGNFEQGGIVPGTSFSGDRLTANVNSGEMILNRRQQANLFNQINGAQGGTQEIIVHTSVNVDGETVARAVSKQVANGFQLGEVR